MTVLLIFITEMNHGRNKFTLGSQIQTHPEQHTANITVHFSITVLIVIWLTDKKKIHIVRKGGFTYANNSIKYAI